MATVDGLETIIKRMDEMKKNGGKNVAQSMVRAGLNVIGKQMKKDVDPKVKEGRKGVRSRFKKNKKKGFVTAKVGFGVGKKSKKTPTVVNRKGGKRGGVGIAAQNIHWWVAGTGQRFTGGKTRRGKRKGVKWSYRKLNGNPIQNRGTMPAMQPGLAAIAYAKAKGQINREMIKRGALQLKKEVVKLQRIK